MKKLFLLIFFISIQLIAANKYFYFESEAFSNIKRIIHNDKYFYVLNNSERIIFTKTSDTDGHIIKKIVSNGQGPFELVYPVDMDIKNNKIFIINQFGEYFIYDLDIDKLSVKKKINYNIKYGNVYKVSFLDTNHLIISFFNFFSGNLNIKNGKICHWIIYNLQDKSITPIWIPINYIPELKLMFKLNTQIFFNYGILNGNEIILTFMGSDHIVIYNLKNQNVDLTLKINHDGYFEPHEVNHKIYGKGAKIPSTFIDKGMPFNNALYFLSGGKDPIRPQLIIIYSNFNYLKKNINVVKEFSGYLSLNSSIFGGYLYYWENWNLMPRPSFGFGKMKLDF